MTHSDPLTCSRLPQPIARSAVTATHSLNVTVAIPTYNGAERLPKVLDQLRSQIGTENITWEIIVCNNCSTDDTAAVTRQYQKTWPAQFPLHYRFAAEQGAAHARQYAVESAKGEIIAFLDDDNIPASNWLAEAYKFAQSHPQAGVVGSQIHGKFETDLPAELTRLKCFLAIIERGDQPHRYEPAKKILPPAAGLVVRKQAWLNAVPKRLFLNNKGKSAGLASEDLEAILHIQKSGWEVWYNPRMVVQHDIPDGRLRKDYLVTLLRCVGLSRYYIRILGIEKWKQPLAIPAYIANDIRKLAFHRLRHGASSQLNTVDRCDRELLTSTLASPLFLLKKAVKDSVQATQDKQHANRRYWLKQITHAFELNAFTLYQQPVVALTAPTNAPQNAPATPDDSHRLDLSLWIPSGQKELLLRLRNEKNDDILPRSFLPTAQRFGLMRTIDRWVITHLCDWVKQHKANNYNNNETSEGSLYSINLSSDSVADASLGKFIAHKLAQSGLAPHMFCFELSAAAAIAQPSQTHQLVSDLHTIGCKITLDNVVTVDRATAELITNLPISYVKLAPEIVQTLHTANGPWKELDSVLHHHQAQAIAVGIESQTTLVAAQRQGIRYAQGYVTGRPAPLKT